jgi:CheY-like chemotaxis protein
MDGPTLLLVEDNILNQKLIFLNLIKYGFKIDVANNGQEAVDKFRERKYNLILMDLMMPLMDGLEATREIRNIESVNGGHTPIVGLTANTYDADREKCLASGMDEFMTKPFDIEIFQSIIKELGIEMAN